MIKVSEIVPGADTCTAVLHVFLDTGESYSGPLIVGYYPDGDEVWIEQEGARVQIPTEHLNEVIKQLRRARKIAKEKP